VHGRKHVHGGVFDVKMLRKPGLRWTRMGAIVLAVSFAFAGRAAEQRAVKVRVAPVYPEIAKRMRISGVVKLEATVDAEGKVMDVKTVSGNHALATAAQDAVRKWRFVPAPVQSTEGMDIKFDLDQ
jgi:TonB family protein